MSNEQQDHIVDVNKKVTSVEWLAEKWSIQGTLYSSDINQAKEMHKEEIMEALKYRYKKDSYTPNFKEQKELFENYYKQTYEDRD